MNELAKHQFACNTCLDRGWIIEQGFSPALEHRAECVPCPDCRPAAIKPAFRKPTRTEQWAVAILFVAVLVATILLV